jgi:hypothetical protein
MPGQGWFAWNRMTHDEYRANLNGLSIFFGAVLGFVMAGTETLGPRDFAFTLFITASAVITILYVSSSRRRIVYALIAAVLIAALPRILGQLLSDGTPIPRNLQPTLAVWLGITVMVEFLPREKAAASASLPREP